MRFIAENLRLKELLYIVSLNRPYFDEFLQFLTGNGYPHLHSFIMEQDPNKAISTILAFFTTPFESHLLDGLGRPFMADKAKWYFLAWVLRDAPAQRLGPLVQQMPGNTPHEKRAALLDLLRRSIAPLLPYPSSWEWPAISEVMLARLEGSRRALKGSQFEESVRGVLRELFEANSLSLRVSDKEVRLHDETYDVEIVGRTGRILMPVKTRETMGGGHALLFTRDIHKSITVAEADGSSCIPVVIAESWGGDLESLPSKHFIFIPMNPNQVAEILPNLRKELAALLPVFASLA